MRKLKRIVKGEAGVDGAGVHLIHVLSRHTMEDSDPLLLLDAFDSTDYDQYKAGFPMHPHRGIETISYVYQGTMVHKDSLGNEDAVNSGGVQWMTSGSGIFHEEMMPEVPRLFGVQLWLNLPKKYKWVKPEYKAINSDQIEEIDFDGGYLRLLAGSYKDHTGFKSKYCPVSYYDIHIKPGQKFSLDLEENDSLTLFSLIGEVYVAGEKLPNFNAGLTELGGKELLLENKSDQEISVLAFISKRIDEPIAWTPGPIVMNTQEELDQAYKEVEEGNFIKDDIEMNL
ncbi:MAG: pirin family protein [Anaerococcus sp.]|nr:pirin family protein [Peptoniphilaceae bacterium]MDY3054980.1 pirin family protein [Anaerococcus sp.]